MEELGYIKDVNGFVHPTAQIVLVTKHERWVCNPVEELKAAIKAGEPFVAHEVRGMVPHELIVNPAHVAAIGTI